MFQSVCTRFVYERPEVDEVLKKCRAFVAHISRNSTASAEMRLQDNLLQVLFIYIIYTYIFIIFTIEP